MHQIQWLSVYLGIDWWSRRIRFAIENLSVRFYIRDENCCRLTMIHRGFSYYFDILIPISESSSFKYFLYPKREHGIQWLSVYLDIDSWYKRPSFAIGNAWVRFYIRDENGCQLTNIHRYSSYYLEFWISISP